MVGPWANVVDFFEPLQWVPTSKRSRARKLHDGLIDVYGSMIRRFKILMDSGEEVPNCLMKMLLESQEEEKLGWEDLCMLAAVFTLGGVHSVSWTLSFISMQLSQEFSRHLASSYGFLLWYPLTHTSRRKLMRNWIESLDMKGAPTQRMSAIVLILGQSSKRYSHLEHIQCG